MIYFAISPSEWLSAERWANFIQPGLFLIMAVLVIFVGLIPIMTVRNKVTEILFGMVFTMMVASLLWGHFENQRYHEFYQQSHYISAQTRQYNVQMFSKQPYDPNEIEALRYIADFSTPSQLTAIYKRYPVKQEVTYLGRGDYDIYVRLDQTRMKFSTSDVRLISGNKAYLSGYRFKMVNQGFIKAGFLKLPNYFRNKLLIPKTLYQHRASQNVVANYDHPGLVGKWIPDSEK